jgi:outer membrane protein TolC
MKANPLVHLRPAFGALLLLAGPLRAQTPAQVAPPPAPAAAANAKRDARKLGDDWLAALRAEAQRKHPSAAAARARLAAAAAGVRMVRLWDDPELGFSLTAARQSMRADDGDIGLGLEQRLPRPGLYAALKSKAAAEQRAQAAEVMAAEAMLGMETAKAALELALADEALALEVLQVEWVKEMAANASERAKDPMAGSAEALRIESELAQERQKLAAMLREREQRAQQLNLLLGRPAAQPWANLSLPGIASAPELQSLLARLSSANPRLQALRHMAAAASAETAVARRERQPEVKLSVDTNTYSGGDFRDAMFGVRVSLPWFNDRAYRANEERAAALASAAQRDLAAAERELQAQAIAASTEARNAAQQADAFAKEIIPAASKAAEAVGNAWISSKATLLEVLEARRSLLAVRLEERRFLAAHRAALETLRALAPQNKR